MPCDEASTCVFDHQFFFKVVSGKKKTKQPSPKQFSAAFAASVLLVRNPSG